MTVTIKVNCGCKFVTDNIEAGIAHTKQTGHIVLVQGVIKPS